MSYENRSWRPRSPAAPAIPPMPAAALPSVRLEAGREKLSRTFHPWVFSGAILDAHPGSAAATDPARRRLLPGLVRVCDQAGEFIAWAQHNPDSKIALRLLEWREEAAPDAAWLAKRLDQAFARRLGPDGQGGGMIGADTSACRLVFSEADHLPGLIVELLGDWLVVQSENRIMDLWMPLVAESLAVLAPRFRPQLAGILERSDGDGRKLENLPARTRLWWTAEAGLAVVDNNASRPISLPEISIRESGLTFSVNLQGQKAGFYTDQRDNRALVARYARGRRVLDVCCYSGGFSVAARAAGASSLCLVDSSAEALDLAKANLAANPPHAGQSASEPEFIQGDAFQILRNLQGRQADGQAPFDLIILDPPKLAPSRNSLERALQAYKDLNLQALKLLEPGGILASFSCSGLVSADDLRQAIAFAAKDAGTQVQILHQLFQAPCHPVLLSFPEGQYLKGFILQLI